MGYEGARSDNRQRSIQDCVLLLHGRALLGLGDRGRRSHLGDIAGVVQADHLDTVERVQIAIPLAEDSNVLGARKVRNFYKKTRQLFRSLAWLFKSNRLQILPWLHGLSHLVSFVFLFSD